MLLGRTAAVRKADGGRIAIVTSSMTFLCLYISRWWRQTWDTPLYFTVVDQSEARISIEHGINNHIAMICDRHYGSLAALQWRHNERHGVSNHQHFDCLFSRLFRRTSKKTSNRRVSGLCRGDSPVTGEFPAQRASDVENVSIWWRHHDRVSAETPVEYQSNLTTSKHKVDG